MPATSFTLRPSGENAFFGMGFTPVLSTTVLPDTVFTSSPNTPTVFNPSESALAKVSSELGTIRTEKKSNWLSIFLAAAAGGLLTYYIVTKLVK